jgi:hypothetical protein
MAPMVSIATFFSPSLVLFQLDESPLLFGHHEVGLVMFKDLVLP